VAALLKHLQVEKADFFGFSNGGSTALQIGIHHPRIVNKIIAASAIYKREGMYPWFWDLMKNASVENMPKPLKDAYLKINPDPKALQIMHDRDTKRMIDFKDWPPEDIKSVKSPVLILIGDKDVVRPEHALEMFRLLPDAELVILPGGHGAYIGEITMANENSKIPEAAVLIVEEFLDKPLKENTAHSSN
jgi:pimeloyl-ACP methyl ester carboxylesterase